MKDDLINQLKDEKQFLDKIKEVQNMTKEKKEKILKRAEDKTLTLSKEELKKIKTALDEVSHVSSGSLLKFFTF